MDTKRIENEKLELVVKLNRDEICLSDPGRGTPAMVYHYNGASATYWCAVGSGELESNAGRITVLTQKQLDWLECLMKPIEAFLYDLVDNAFELEAG